MQPPSEPLPGSAFAQFKEFTRKILSVSKEDLDAMRKREAKNKARREKAKEDRQAS
jgi:hypothetical protein